MLSFVLSEIKLNRMSELEDIKDSVKTWFNNRLKNPYFASVIAVWLFINRVVVFGLFNFDDTQTLQERVLWVQEQLNNKEVWLLGTWHFEGFKEIIAYSFIVGLFTMVIFNYAN